MQFPRLIVIALAATLAPGAAATWYSFGTYEPDNAHDTPAFMWENAPVSGQQRVYFNAYTGVAPGLRAVLINPNVGALETSNEAPALEYHMAMLGVWVDCNGDGYVGLAETAQREYPAELLLDDSVCPLVTGDVNVWTPGAHNYNGWVSEYVPIGGTTTDPQDDANDSRVYRDPDAMVWGDNGLPDSPATAGGSCALAPQPRGTYQSTGGFLNYADCSSGLMERWNEAFFGRQIAGQDAPGLYDLGVPDLGLTFENDDDARGSWMDVDTFGSEDSSNTAVYVVDCSEEPFLNVGDAINDTAGDDSGLYELDESTVSSGIWSTDVREPSPSPGSSSPNLPGTVNETNEELAGDCDTTNDAGHDFYGAKAFYLGEADFNSVSTANKRSASWNIQFVDSARDGLMQTVVDGVDTPAAPVYGGRAGAQQAGTAYSNWNSPSVLVKAGPRTIAADIASGEVTIPGAQLFTFYAHVGATTIARGLALPGGSGFYAGPQCEGNNEGIHNGWNCDPGEWYLNPDGTPVPEAFPFARPGQQYELRDIDCHDGRNNLGVPLGTPAYGDNPCPV